MSTQLSRVTLFLLLDVDAGLVFAKIFSSSYGAFHPLVSSIRFSRPKSSPSRGQPKARFGPPVQGSEPPPRRCSPRKGCRKEQVGSEDARTASGLPPQSFPPFRFPTSWCTLLKLNIFINFFFTYLLAKTRLVLSYSNIF